MLIEIRPYVRDRRIWQKMQALLRRHTQQPFGDNLDKFEATHGPIKLPGPEDPSRAQIGFKN